MTLTFYLRYKIESQQVRIIKRKAAADVLDAIRKVAYKRLNFCTEPIKPSHLC